MPDQRQADILYHTRHCENVTNNLRRKYENTGKKKLTDKEFGISTVKIYKILFYVIFLPNRRKFDLANSLSCMGVRKHWAFRI